MGAEAVKGLRPATLKTEGYVAQDHRVSPVSVLIPVRNEEANLREALESVRWADEVWVIDSQSSDKTVEIAEENGAQVVQFHYTGTGAKKKNWALENTPFRNEWVLVLDADERVSPQLAEEISASITKSGFDGFFVNREYVFLGRNLRCFQPNWNLRLFRHRLGRYELLATNTPHTGDNEIHEHVVLKGQAGHLRFSITNEDRRPLRAWIQNHNRYSDWEAEVYRQFLAEPIKLSAIFSSEPVWRRRALKRIWLRLPFRPLARFLILYVGRRGFRDGRPGFIYAALMGYYEFMTSIKTYEARLRSLPE